MSFGAFIPSIALEVGTPEEMKTAVLIKIIECRSWYGSVSVPGYDSTKGFFIVKQTGISDTARQTPRCVFNNSTKVFSWSVGGVGNINDGMWSRSFDAYFFFSEGS